MAMDFPITLALPPCCSRTRRGEQADVSSGNRYKYPIAWFCLQLEELIKGKQSELIVPDASLHWRFDQCIFRTS